MSAHGTEIARVTLQGSRENNQDRFAVFEEHDACLLVLGDGLGGHPRGEVAAQLLVETCQKLWQAAHKPLVNPRYFLQQCALKAHEAILGFGSRQTPPITPRTTAVMALLQEGRCYWGHAGDSRFYLVREGEILVRSRDHVVANVLDQDKARSLSLNPGALTRCLGGSHSAQPLIGDPVTLQPGDIVLLCSDGFWHQLDESEMVTTLHNAFPLSKALSLLGERAEANKIGNSDNISAVGVRLGSKSFGIGQTPMNGPLDDEEAELLQAIEHLNKLIERTL